MRTLGVATISLLFVFLTGCTRAVSDKSTLTIQFPSGNETPALQKLQKVQAASNVGALATSKWGLPLPTSFSEINCFAIAIRTPEVPAAITCTDINGTAQTTDYFVGLFPRNGATEIEVPSGEDRKIQLVGFVADNTSYCVDLGVNGGTLAAAHFSPPVLLSTIYRDLTPGIVDVRFEIPSNLAGSDDFEECDTKPLASSTIIEAVASGYPSVVSATTTFAATVKGFNATEYAYELSNDTTCSFPVLSTPTWNLINTPITSPMFSGFSDGPMALCILGRSSSGVQTLPTKHVFTRDFLAPASFSLNLPIYTASSQTTITFSGLEVGTTVKIFSELTGSTSCDPGDFVESFTATSSTTTYTTTQTFSEGRRYFSAMMIDAGLNETCSGPAWTTIDFTAPAAPVLIGSGYGIYSAMSPYFSWTESTDLGGTGVAHYEVAIGTYLGTVNSISDWNPIGNVFNYTYLGGPFLDGTVYTFSIRARDAAGNRSGIVTKYWTARTISPRWQQQAYFKASNADPADYFGWAVDVDGDRMVVGAPYEDSASTSVATTGSADNSAPLTGAVYVYKRNVSGTWVEEAYLKPDNAHYGQQFGFSVGISGDTIVVGSPFEKSSAAGVSSTGDTSSLTGSNYGAVYTFKYNGTSWVKENYIKPIGPPPNGKFGYAVSIDGNTLVATAPYYSDLPVYPDSGAAYVFARSTGNWTQQIIKKESTLTSYSRFGMSVSLHQGRFAVGTSPSTSQTGAVEIFEQAADNTWSYVARLTNANKTNYDRFGEAVSLYGDRVAVGAFQEGFSGGTGGTGGDGGTGEEVTATAAPTISYGTYSPATISGAVYVFERASQYSWPISAYLKPSTTNAENFGYSVSLFENTLIVGAPNSVSGTGAVYAYKIPSVGADGGSYTANRMYSPFEQSSPSKFGHSVAINNSAISIGGYIERSTTKAIQNGATYTPAFDATSDHGAAWIYEVNGP